MQLQEKMFDNTFWQDPSSAKVAQTADSLKKDIAFWEELDKKISDLEELVKISESDSELTGQINQQSKDIERKLAEVRVRTLLSGKYDASDALFAIHAGAGGTDAQDWVEMLLRMYLRYAELKKFKVEVLSKSQGTEAGLKSVMLHISGEHAYGFLKNEAGVHRLVRISPFNTGKTRETSFALVEVLPVIPEAEVKLDPKDIKIDTSTASGHGGQSVNTTYSAVRVTHLPTGITVSIQNERSQHQNKEKALEILRSRLAKLEEEKREKERKELRGEFHSPEWGNQIRSYVLHPYKLVKDHRTDFETSDVDSVLNGEIDEFIEKALEAKV